MQTFYGLCLTGIGEEIGDEIKTIKDKLVPNFFSFLVQFLALVVLITVVILCAYKPMKKMLNKRADFIANNIADSEKNKTKAEENLAVSEKLIQESKKKAVNIIEQAQNDALKQKEELLNKAQGEIAILKQKAQEDIKQSRLETLDAVHKEMVNVALMASEEILKREVNAEDNARLANEFIDKLD